MIHTADDYDGNVGDVYDDAKIHLFEQQEQDLLEIQLSSSSSSSSGLSSSSSSSVANHTLRIRQFGSSDNRWGIHSSVWDGGIALLKYVSTYWEPLVQLRRQRLVRNNSNEARHKKLPAEEDDDHTSLLVIDLGSGTGITGLGIAALLGHYRCRYNVVVTDLPEALPLLQENVELNASHWNKSGGQAPLVKELTWGCINIDRACDTDWLPQLLEGATNRQQQYATKTTESSSATRRRRRRVLITGADIVYRPSLFQPLLTTLIELHRLLIHNHGFSPAELDIWFSCQSTRSHLREFWEAASQRGFESKRLASVRLGQTKMDLAQGTITEMTTFDHNNSRAITLDTSTAKGDHDVYWIIALRKTTEDRAET